MEPVQTNISDTRLLTIDQFKTMDYKAIRDYSLSIEMMMENAGLLLARFITLHASIESRILFGIGTGNNGGGGLVAARRLAGWGFICLLRIVSLHWLHLNQS